MEILSIAVNDINPAQYNPRKDLQPGDPEYEKLKKSILEFDMVEPLVWNKQTGNLVGGSGSTLIACEKLDRRCFMMEIDEHYCDVIIQRWQDFTGRKAEKLNGK